MGASCGKHCPTRRGKVKAIASAPWGKQELRKLESNEAATTMNMLLFGMTELATWERSQGELVDRSESPWDDGERRPSHADRRNFLRRAMLTKDFYGALRGAKITKKFIS